MTPVADTGAAVAMTAPTLAMPLSPSRPSVRFGRPRWRGDVVRDWWAECKRILAAACPFIPVPSPVRERLPAAA